MSSLIPKTADQRVLEHMRCMSERKLHTDVVFPLLSHMGAQHVQYVHGAFERGKDFLYITSNIYQAVQLEVCQVKNEPFSGKAGHQNNTVATLNQVLQCRVIEVLNPVTHTKELPASVTLITTYDVPDKDLADGRPLLAHLKEQNCQIIGPGKLLRLLEHFLPRYYAEIATPGTGVARAMRSHVVFHQEAPAFDLVSRRLLADFFVNLGLAPSARGLSALSTGRTPLMYKAPTDLPNAARRYIAETNHTLFEAMRGALPSPLSHCRLLTWGKTTARVHGVQCRRLDSADFRDFLRQLSAIALNAALPDASLRNSSPGSVGDALRLVAMANEVMLAAMRIMKQSDCEPVSDSTQTSIQLQIPEVPPESLLNFRNNLCIVGNGGSGKTSLARMLAQAAIDRNLKCVYFPCSRLQHRNANLKSDLIEFLRNMDSDLDAKLVDQYVRDAELIILDGCDEAVNYNTTLGQQIQTLVFPCPVRVPLAAEIVRCFPIPNDLQDSLRYDGRDAELVLHEPLTELALERLRKTWTEPVVGRLKTACDASAPRIIVTTRMAVPLHLSASFHRLQILPFTPAQRNRFFHKWFHDRPADATTVVHHVQRNPSIGEICCTPMIATIVAALQENSAAMPRSRTQVYQRRFDLLLDRWDKSKGMLNRNVIDPEDKLTLLSRLAFDVHKAHRRSFTRRDLARIWRTTLAHRYPSIPIEDVIWELRFSNAMLFPTGTAEFTLGHLSYQEFLCARSILHGQRSDVLLDNFLDPWWSQVLLFFAGLSGDIRVLLERIQSTYPLDIGKSDVLSTIVREARYTGAAATDAVADMMAEDFGTRIESESVLDDELPEV